MKELAYVALGAALVFTALALRHLKLPRLRLPRIPYVYLRIRIKRRTFNSFLIAMCIWSTLCWLIVLTLPVHEFDDDNILVEWVRIPRAMPKRVKPKIKEIKPRVTTPKSFHVPRPAPQAKPLDLKAAASRSFAAVRENPDLSVPEVQTAEIATAARIPAKPHEITLSPTGDGGVSRRGQLAGGVGDAPGRGTGGGGGGNAMGWAAW